MGIFGDGSAPFIVGLSIGTVLLVGGAVGGYLVGRRLRPRSDSQSFESRRVLELLKELAGWTREYRGGVAQYQDRLGELQAAVAGAANGVRAAGAGGGPGVVGVMPLVEQLMENNRQLQTRLDAAEQQLQYQTAQIQSCLSEARTDALTGLANRRAFDAKLEELLAAFQRGGRAFVLALVDIDHFKQINDTYGHPVGDEVLRQMAGRLTRGVEEALMVARVGGEEFALLLPSPLTRAATSMDALRKHCATNPIACENRRLTITLSVGLCEARDGAIFELLVRRADEAMYAAKGTGRNRTYYHDGAAPTLFGAPEVVGRV